MSEENLPPIPAQVPQEKEMSIALGVLAVLGSLFCWIVGLILSIIGLCKYRKGSAGRVLSWIGIAIFVAWTACCVAVACLAMETMEETMENIRRDHPELNDQQIMEYMRDPANKEELQKYMQNSLIMELAD